MLLLIFTLGGQHLLDIPGLRYMALFIGVTFGTGGGPITLAVCCLSLLPLLIPPSNPPHLSNMAHLLLYHQWAMNNSPNPGVRAVSTAIIIGFGTIGSFIASWTYTNKEAPLYVTGHAINMGFSVTAVALIAVYWWYCSWENRQRDLGRRDYRLVDLSQEEIDDLGHRHPDFRYAS